MVSKVEVRNNRINVRAVPRELDINKSNKLNFELECKCLVFV